MTAAELAHVYESALSAFSVLQPHSVRMAGEYEKIYQTVLSSIRSLKIHNLKRKRDDEETTDHFVDVVRMKEVPCKRLADYFPKDMDVDDAVWIQLDQSLLDHWISLAS